MREVFEELESILLHDPGGRGVADRHLRGHLEGAARSLLEARRVLIVTGFPIARARTGETDGPPGARALGSALEELGVGVAMTSDAWTRPLLRALDLEVEDSWEDLLERFEPTHLVSVERPGRAVDGLYYNARGEDITSLVEPLDELFIEARRCGLPTIGIGDGGNEIGLGRAVDGSGIPKPPESVIETDWSLVAGTSNWAAYALVGGLSGLTGRSLLPDFETERIDLERLVAAGAVDGLTGKKEPTVDGLRGEETERVISFISEILHI